MIAFTDTWLKDTNAHAFGLDRYNSVHNCNNIEKAEAWHCMLKTVLVSLSVKFVP